MPPFVEKFRALLATGRVANLPTVWSNVLVAHTMATSFTYFGYTIEYGNDPIILPSFVFLIIASSLIYLGGCMLGDARDIEYDSIHKPDRPIPSGIISATSVTLIAWSLLMAGLSLIAVSSTAIYNRTYNYTWTDFKDLFNSSVWLSTLQPHQIILCCLLVTSIVCYAYIHKKHRTAALILMAFCRVQLVFLAISAVHQSWLLPYFLQPVSDDIFMHWKWVVPWMPVLACIVGIYTLLLSWVASTEASPSVFSFRKTLAVGMLALPLVSIWFNSFISAGQTPPWRQEQLDGKFFTVANNLSTSHWIVLILALAWTGHTLRALKTSKPLFVSRALAGFCLLDAVMIAGNSPIVALICIVLFGLALLLQRVTPAT